MASMQEPAPGGKSAKFVNANPLAPMVDPFQHLVSLFIFIFVCLFVCFCFARDEENQTNDNACYDPLFFSIPHHSYLQSILFSL